MARRPLRRALLWLGSLLVLLLGAVVAFLLWFHIPSNAAGMAAKSVCSAALVAGREGTAEELMEADVLPASPVLRAISTDLDREAGTATSRFLGLFERTATLLPDRGCVLDGTSQGGTGQDAAAAYVPAAKPGAWPDGDEPVAEEERSAGVDVDRLSAVLDEAFEGSGDPALANARGVAVVQDGQLLAVRDGLDIAPGTALHGWSMTKTVSAMLAWQRFDEVGLDVETAVVDAFPPGREPSWVAEWRTDERADITVADLLYMRPGLDLDESYDPWGQVVQMLYGEDDMPAWAAQADSSAPAGEEWEYLSAVSNLLAAVVRAQFEGDEEYWAYPREALFAAIGADSATLETDADGTWVSSSYLWADVTDWARFGQLMLDDGRWGEQEVLTPGWWDVATTPAVADGEGHGYGAQSWLLGDPVGGECRDEEGVPEDTVAMEGHWGQLVAMVPSRRAVIVRLGWTFDSDTFDGCSFIANTLESLAP